MEYAFITVYKKRGKGFGNGGYKIKLQIRLSDGSQRIQNCRRRLNGVISFGRKCGSPDKAWGPECRKKI